MVSLMENWEAVVGAEIAGLCVPHGFMRGHRKERVLVLAAVGANQIEVEYRGAHIIQRVNRWIEGSKEKPVERIRVVNRPLS